VELAEQITPPPGMDFQGLRALYGRLDEPLYALAGRAAQIIAWDRDHQFCGRCGEATEPLPDERARRCPACGLTAFPRLSPAVIVLIERGETILLARGHHFQPGRFGIIAGFVEPGESLEEAVRREISEEVGLAVRDVRYFGSQPWPYPHAIMIGFTAVSPAGEIRLDPQELAEAGWYTLDDLPMVPQKLSIARRLIDAWAARYGRVIDQP
jgi:NAD+ diphosphatase